MALMFIVMIYASDVPASTSTEQHGSPCTYKQYHGEACIISICTAPEEPGFYEIKFTFQTGETIQEEFANPKGRQWSLLQKSISLPDEKFIKKFGIKTGKYLPCTMNVITKGTSTPVWFDFPTIEDGRGH